MISFLIFRSMKCWKLGLRLKTIFYYTVHLVFWKALVTTLFTSLLFYLYAIFMVSCFFQSTGEALSKAFDSGSENGMIMFFYKQYTGILFIKDQETKSQRPMSVKSHIHWYRFKFKLEVQLPQKHFLCKLLNCSMLWRWCKLVDFVCYRFR